MKLTIGLKLIPTREQRDALRETLERANAAANAASQIAWKTQVFGQFPLHKLVYRSLRDVFGLFGTTGRASDHKSCRCVSARHQEEKILLQTRLNPI